ncbi:exodeoxyribonuclease III [Corynebacterium caspium]|uniref:exodeoxyribonuclease III n=1 Tax=Corynebacterium caspium TaxID=234828 RepID=UPI0003798E67|nr:exodeoxyribonuclease III [Corynebacterium caspium]WKD58669.1 Exodeoxyribonuclease III [Corynebacterium caspium DSM 44850]
MRIATWNVNSARARVARIQSLLTEHDIDVLAIQETKCTDANFPRADFEKLGYEVAHVGYSQWNGVAILSRVGLSDIANEFPGQPGFHKDPQQPQKIEARAVGATCGGVRVWSLYIPNGRAVTDRHYTYKLHWLKALSEYAASSLAENPQQDLALMGDFNVAPRDEDVWDMAAFAGSTHVTDAERANFELLEEAGLTEVTRQFTAADRYTYWDYKGGRFYKDEGMRIDFQFASTNLAARAQKGFVDKEERAKRGSSDHALVLVDYAASPTP